MIRIRCSSHHEKLKRYAIEVLLKHWFKIDYEVSFTSDDIRSYEIQIDSSEGLKTLVLPDFLSLFPEHIRWSDIEPMLTLREWNVTAQFPNIQLCSSNLPVFLSESGREFFVTTGDRSFLNVDVFGFAAIFLTRLEEWDEQSEKKTKRDELARAIGKQSFAHRHDVLERPLVDEYSNLLLAALKKLDPNFSYQFPHAAVEISHDVDHPFRFRGISPVRALVRAVKDGGIGGLFRLKGIRSGKNPDPYDAFDFFMEVAKKNDVPSTYFLIEGHHVSQDGFFNLEAPAMKELVSRLELGNQTLGLHGSFTSHLDGKKLKAEVAGLRSQMDSPPERIPARQHYLRWHPRTPKLLCEAGAGSDWSMGYQDQPGFRAGTSRIYPWFDLETGEKIGIDIHPLVLMDATLLSPGYLGKNAEEALRLGLRLRDRCFRVGGSFSILWHNHNLPGKRERDLFQNLVSGRPSP